MTTPADLLCFSPLRWGFVFQRAQHLMVRFARTRRVFFIEEPHRTDGVSTATVTVHDGVHVVEPYLPRDVAAEHVTDLQRQLLAAVLSGYGVDRPAAWLYSPIALPLLEGVAVSTLVYDCTDGPESPLAPPELRAREAALMARADVVFTGGYSLFEAKRFLHANMHPIPSSVDTAHFMRARRRGPVPLDQQRIARPRVGFAGVIDARLDLDLVRGLAERRPDWQIVMLGPVEGLDDGLLPRAANIHYLGLKSYAELPDYFAGWDVALLPYARNEATRFISPTKTPEYLAAGLPVVSTSIRDVVRPYAEEGYVQIADTVDDFVAAVSVAMTPGGRAGVRRAQAMLDTMSWDRTYEDVRDLMEAATVKPLTMRLVSPPRSGRALANPA
jgi:glycosyltransferase involved in cell wall biosynthesis